MQGIKQVSDGLYLGSLENTNCQETLQLQKITNILYLGNSAKNFETSSKIIEISDRKNCNLTEYFEECYDYISLVLKNKGKVLVCCDSGISLAPTVVIAYIMRRKECNYFPALEFVRRSHPDARPNQDFTNQLRAYQAMVSKKCKNEGMSEIRCGCECF